MSYDIVGTVSESCQTESTSGAISGTVSFSCTSYDQSEYLTGTLSWSCDTFDRAASPVGDETLQWDCDSFEPAAFDTGSLSWACSTYETETLVADIDIDPWVFEEGRAVLTGRPRENDFVYIEDPDTGTEELVRTYGDDSILAFVEGDGVVSLPVDDS